VTLPHDNEDDIRGRLEEAQAGIDWLRGRERGDFRLEERLGSILRYGVHASSACLAVGLVLGLATAHGAAASMLMTLGLMMLMATPVARVAASVVEYARLRDWIFFILTGIVLLELCAGVVAALVFHGRL
jgi:uncharacterized membrane protein